MDIPGNISGNTPISSTPSPSATTGTKQIHGTPVSDKDYADGFIMNVYIFAIFDAVNTGLSAMLAVQGRSDATNQIILKLTSNVREFKLVPISQSTGSNQGNITNEQILNQISQQNQMKVQSSISSAQNKQAIVSSLSQGMAQTTSNLTEQFNSALGQVGELTLTLCLSK
jgi:hypothetical protein